MTRFVVVMQDKDTGESKYLNMCSSKSKAAEAIEELKMIDQMTGCNNNMFEYSVVSMSEDEYMNKLRTQFASFISNLNEYRN